LVIVLQAVCVPLDDHYENDNVTHINNYWSDFDGGNESNISHAQTKNETHPLLRLGKGTPRPYYFHILLS